MPRILLADGSAERQLALSNTLVAAGYEVMKSTYGEVLLLLLDFNPDLLLMELVTEEGDGFEFMRATIENFK